GGRLGSSFRSAAGSHTTLVGYDFKVDGVPVAELANVGDSKLINPGSSFLSGILSDGTPFMLSSQDGDFSSGLSSSELTFQLSAPVAAPPTVFNVPTDAVPKGVLSGQTLNLNSGGVLPAHYNAHSGSTVNIHGGSVGTDFEAYQSNVTIDGGTFG